MTRCGFTTPTILTVTSGFPVPSFWATGTSFVDYDPSQHASIMGVHFKPGGAFPFFGAVVGELAGTHVSLEELWGSSAVEFAGTAMCRFYS